MSGNNSLRETTGAPEANLASEYALRVALQTIKERCVSLHQRLAIVEEENLAMKSKLTAEDDEQGRGIKCGTRSDSEALRDRLAKVTKEKLQLSEHIEMVTKENRQLWSRLSQLIKDQNQNKQRTADAAESRNSNSTQKLIRSETFTQHSPNVLLRPKPIVANASARGNDEASSMEDVSLKNFGEYLDDRYKLPISASGPRTTTLNFGYLNDEASRLGDFSQDLNNCSVGMQDMKLEMKRQQNKIKVLIDLVKDRRANPECSDCRKRKEKPEMADKGLETEECLLNTQWSVSIPRPDRKELDSYDGSTHLNILEQKRLADELDKLCPLCGKMFTNAVEFEDFRDHVETHFLDELLDQDASSVENNFEFISHTVGNF